LPGSESGGITVGNTTIFASPPHLLSELAESSLAEQLSLAEAAWNSGQRLGVVVGLRLWSKHKRSEPYPGWLTSGIEELLTAGSDARRHSGTKSKPLRKGRLSREESLRTQRYLDFVRAMEVNRWLNSGLTHGAACRRASSELEIQVKGQPTASSAKVFEQAYVRFYRRAIDAPLEFYPILTGHMVMQILGETPCGGVAEAIIREYFTRPPARK
jgi:hypothetical protein